MRPALGFAVAAALVLLTVRARAQPATYELSYAAPSGCPTQKEVAAEVRANVRDATSGDGARITLSIVQDGTVFTGELVALDRSGKQGRRRIQGPTCADVSHTLAFLAALAIELGGRVEEESSTPPPTAAPTPAPSVVKPAPPSAPPPPSRAPRSSWSWAGVLGGGLRGGLAPSARPAAEVGVDYGDSSVRIVAPALRVTALGAFSRIVHDAGTAKLSLLAARLEGCPLRFGPRAIALRPCVGLEFGAVFARGELDGGRSVVEPWGSAEAVLRFEAWISRQVWLELSGAAVVPFFHTRYFFVPEQIIYVVPAVTGRAGLAVGFRFQ